MWSDEHSIEIAASAAQIWALFADVAGWQACNAGIERIGLHGPFATGTTFTMKPPGTEAFLSTLLRVTEPRSFVDETRIARVRVVVRHALAALPSGNTRVTYRTEIFGPGAADFGPLVSSDFPQVLRALKQLAERPG